MAEFDKFRLTYQELSRLNILATITHNRLPGILQIDLHSLPGGRLSALIARCRSAMKLNLTAKFDLHLHLVGF